MKWVIEGARRDTGDSVITEVDASDKQTAIAFASRRGVLVASVKAKNGQPPEVGGGAAVAEVAKVAPVEVPAYRSLAIAGVLLVLAACGAWLRIANILLSLANQGRSIDSAIVGGVNDALFAAGAVMFGLGAICFAVRDIVRNSFRSNPPPR